MQGTRRIQEMYILVGPDGSHQVDNEQIVRVEEKSDTADGVELHVTSRHDTPETGELGILFALIFLLHRNISVRHPQYHESNCDEEIRLKTYHRHEIAILVATAVSLFFPPHFD